MQARSVIAGPLAHCRLNGRNRSGLTCDTCICVADHTNSQNCSDALQRNQTERSFGRVSASVSPTASLCVTEPKRVARAPNEIAMASTST